MGSAEISIAISFVGFIYVFRTRIYPVVARALDEHIQSVQNKISEAESLKDESSLALKKAHTNKNSTAELIEKSKLASHEKIKRLKSENEEYLKMLKERFAASLEIQLNAELAKQKDLLIEKLADQVVERLSQRVNSSDCEVSINFTKEELQKLNSF